MEYHNFKELVSSVKAGNRRTVVVAAAQEVHTLKAVLKARQEGAVECILVGKKQEIMCITGELDYQIEERVIVEAKEDTEAAYKAVEMIRNGQGDFLMKGRIETGTFLKQVVNKETGIGAGGTMCHMALMEIPAYPKLLGLTDSGMVISPTLEQKADIIKAGVDMLRNMGIENPKVACLTAVEKCNPNMPETKESVLLKERAIAGEFGRCCVEGPISCDLTFSEEAARAKNYHSAVTGDADLLLVPNMVTGNVLGKALIAMAGAKMAGCILGAKVPVVLTSRGSSLEEKYNSLMLCARGIA